MNNSKDDFPSVGPLEGYEGPDIPTLADTFKDASILKTLPARWKRNAKVIACAGLIGAVTLSGCVPAEQPQTGDEGAREAQLETHIEQNGSDARNGYTGYNGYYGQNGEDGYRVQNGDDEQEERTVRYGYSWKRDDDEQSVVVRQNTQSEQDDWFYSGRDRIIPVQIEYNGYSEMDLVLRSHWGGGGFAIYVVYLTEQEAFGIVRSQLEAAGLNFGAPPPDNSVTIGVECNDEILYDQWNECCYWDICWSRDIGFDLFDAENSVGIKFLYAYRGTQSMWMQERFFEEIEAGFAAQLPDVRFGLFREATQVLGSNRDGFWDENKAMYVEQQSLTGEEAVLEKATAEAPFIAANLKANLIAQTQQFIALLQEEGILPDPNDE